MLFGDPVIDFPTGAINEIVGDTVMLWKILMITTILWICGQIIFHYEYPPKPFHPSNLEGVVGWWTANHIIIEEGKVKLWVDKSGNANHLILYGDAYVSEGFHFDRDLEESEKKLIENYLASYR